MINSKTIILLYTLSIYINQLFEVTGAEASDRSLLHIKFRLLCQVLRSFARIDRSTKHRLMQMIASLHWQSSIKAQWITFMCMIGVEVARVRFHLKTYKFFLESHQKVRSLPWSSQWSKTSSGTWNTWHGKVVTAQF